MPTLSEQANAELMKQLMQREMADKVMPQGPLVPHEGPDAMTAMSPEKLALMGGLADAASTAYALSQGRVESNPEFAFAHNNPMATGAAVLGDSLLNFGGRNLARKLPIPFLKRLADIVAANRGSEQLGLAVANTDTTGPNAFEVYHNTIQRSRTR